jgi:hypothetical protein
MLGITADSIMVKKMFGVDYTFADFHDKNHAKMNQIIAIQGHPHWVNPAFAELAWEFMSKFSRSPDGSLAVAQQ